jgi:hypothetical protein
MASWKKCAILAIVLAAAPGATAQPQYTLKEEIRVGDCFQIQLAMKLSGEWHVPKEDKTVPLKLSAAAAHAFAERCLCVGTTGLPTRTVRHYQTARAAITAGGVESERSLRPELSLIVAQRDPDALICYSPDGPLTREELETLEHLDTLHITGILPERPAAAGDTWKLSNLAAQALCSLDGLIDHDLTGKLESVEGNEARIGVHGSASGISLGAMTRITIRAAAMFDLQSRRLVRLEWQQNDTRDQGPANPATTVEAVWTMTRTALESEPRELSDVALVRSKVPQGEELLPESSLQLLHRDRRDRFLLIHDREWHLAAETDSHLILRLMDRGDWVAQATITPWKKAAPKEHLSADEFKELIDETPGWDPEEVRDDGELRSEKGNWVYRVSALGNLDGLKVLQSFYLVAGPEGDQAIVMVTLRPALAEKLGTRDLKLVDGISFPQK